jgi:hypothetical protein
MPAIVAGCVGGDLAAAPDQTGPTLVVEVSNFSADEIRVGYEFTADGLGGSGGMLVPACRLETQVSMVIGEYEVLVEGKSVADGTVPGGIADDKFFIIRLRIGPDGAVAAAPPLVMATQPNVSAAIPGCS